MLKIRQVVTLAAVTALAPIALDMYLPASVEMAFALGVTASEATYSISIFLIGIATGQVFAGPLSDRFGRKPMIHGGLTVFAIASLVSGYTDSFAVLLAARLFQAFGACAVLSSARAIVSDKLDGREAAKLFSQMALVSGLAPILAPMVGAWLTHMGTWRLNFLVMAGMAVAMFIASYFLLPESRSADTAANARNEHPFQAYWNLLRNKRLRLYLIAAAFNSAGFFTYLANSPGVFLDVFGLSPTQYSLIFACNSAALVSATQINRYFLRENDLDQVLAKSGRNAILLAAGLIVFAFTQIGGLAVFCGLLFLLAGSVSPVQANTMAGGLSTATMRGGSAAALFGATTFSAGALVSWLGGMFYDGSPTPLCLLLAACLICASMAIRQITKHSAEGPAAA